METSDCKFQVYIISSSRYERGMVTAKNFVDYKHVVRDSQKQLYIDHGFENVISFPDEDINAYSKVFNYLIEHAPEDVIAIVDDDIDHFKYRTNVTSKITDPEIVQAEFERLGQMIFDLGIGLAIGSPTSIPYNYTSEFSWFGIPGAWKIVNTKKCKARMDPEIYRNVDIDFVLQEVLMNRIVLDSKYLCSEGFIDKSTTTSGSVYSKKNIDDSIEMMELKWGRYFKYNAKNAVPMILVER